MSRLRTFVVACVTVATATVILWRTLTWGGITIASPATTSPKIVLEQDSFDLGTVSSGAPFSLNVRVGNSGRHRLVVRQQPTGCDCSGARAESACIVTPGSWQSMSVAAGATRKIGLATETLVLHTNDPERPSVPIVVNYRVVGMD